VDLPSHRHKKTPLKSAVFLSVQIQVAIKLLEL
jgi:hypothetical protein